MRSERAATVLVLAGPAALLGGALAFQYIGGLQPCEMCLWQRWPHVAALVLGLIAWSFRNDRRVVALAGLVLLGGAGLAAFHVGVEYHWWQGPSACTAKATHGSLADITAQVLAMPLVFCDAAAWRLFGISMAGYNALFSLVIGGSALWLTGRR